jgi:hypothetical protein
MVASSKNAVLVGPAEVTEQTLTDIVSEALGAPTALREWCAEPVGYVSGSPATGALVRVHGSTADGQSWSLFVKVLQHVRHWPLLELMPAPLRATFAAEFPWRAELVAWEPEFTEQLPAGLRVPRLYRVVAPRRPEPLGVPTAAPPRPARHSSPDHVAR